ncbi:phage integrase family protein [Fulvivirga imtechensis AK7]|uniref:Phage integrase family protein n=1 Tax=Fulvivirga imtechensis AK7 TaxID=1237149 RepID=L8JNL9_9BACT|nr:tyrosine-type recombinase/integrase [Fulvivirga imtechensis]ELR68977.1 phage integrase family protein [Fulvivirga imtechensis AK7]
MKHLPIFNKEYRKLLKDFGVYLERMGYNKNTQSMLPSCLQEFFYRMEQQGINTLDQLTPGLIRKHYEYLTERPNRTRPGGLSDSMINHHMYALKTFINYQQESGNMHTNPFSVLNFPKVKCPPRQVLTIEEIKALYNACENMKDRAMLGLFYGCGLRRSEAMKLNIIDINFKSQLLYVRSGKGRKRRVVPLTDQVKTDLQNYYLYERGLQVREITKDNQNAFILNRHGNRMVEYWKRLKYLVKQAELPEQISLHHLRHSIATHLLESGLSIEQVRDFLGHRYLESTQIYTRISKQYLASQTV